MLKGKDEKIYGVAFWDRRYKEGTWNLHFYRTEFERDGWMQEFKALGFSKAIPFEFSLEQVLGEDEQKRKE